jgi:hypothetical protein
MAKTNHLILTLLLTASYLRSSSSGFMAAAHSQGVFPAMPDIRMIRGLFAAFRPALYWSLCFSSAGVRLSFGRESRAFCQASTLGLFSLTVRAWFCVQIHQGRCRSVGNNTHVLSCGKSCPGLGIAWIELRSLPGYIVSVLDDP